MIKYLLKNSVVIHIIFIFLLLEGCTTQAKKPDIPASLEKEIKSIEDPKSAGTSQYRSSGEKIIYTVKKGDTLWRISKNHSVPVDTILRVNRIGNVKDLQVGQKLIIPVSGKSYSPSASYTDYKPTGDTPGNASSSSFIWPVKGQIVSKFGELRNGVKNMGICILPQPGQKIVASKRGIVEAVSDADNGTYILVIKHDGGIRTIYGCHCNPIVGEGSYVEQGQPIANISQLNTGKHQEINFKVYIKDKPVNPMSYLP